MSNTICMNAAPNGTFMNLPSAALVSETFHPRACIVGIPFDCGTHPFRVGSREGPSAIRAQSRLLRHYETGAKGSAANPTAYLRARTEERRVGKEGVSRCENRGAPEHE